MDAGEILLSQRQKWSPRVGRATRACTCVGCRCQRFVGRKGRDMAFKITA